MLQATPASLQDLPESPCAAGRVRQLRQVLLWPLRLMPVLGREGHRLKPWALLREMGDASPWREVVDATTTSS
jgi:hypothetical protein